jgi:hypothetical protein
MGHDVITHWNTIVGNGLVIDYLMNLSIRHVGIISCTILKITVVHRAPMA